jgi:hypothetical protein
MPAPSALLGAITVLGGAAAPADLASVRPDLQAAQPAARVALQSLGEPRAMPTMMADAVLYADPTAAEDALAVYQHTLLGDWPNEAAVNRDDPWLRFLLVAPQRFVVIDVATFVDGRPFRHGREESIDAILSEAKLASTERQTEGASPPTIPAGLSEGDATAALTPDADPPPDAAAPPNVAAAMRQEAPLRERVLNYVAAAGADVPRDELRWLIAEWGSGPTSIVLGPGLSWQRAGLAPLWALLDRDSDGALAASEIADAGAALSRADADQDDVVEKRELVRAAKRPAVMPFPMGHPLLVALDGNVDWARLGAQLREAYAGRPTTVAADEAKLRELGRQRADVTLRVDFATGANPSAGVSLIETSAELGSGVAVVASASVISLDLGVNFVEISAAQGNVENAADATATQIAIGAVVDGNPLMRLVDRDQDRRLTRRERQELAGIFAALDRNGDGDVGTDETPVPIRFAVTLGANVHTLLGSPTGAAASPAPRSPATLAAPDWFQSMDKNGDRDLTRDEFLGTAKQFAELDADGDALVSVAEAARHSAK